MCGCATLVKIAIILLIRSKKLFVFFRLIFLLSPHSIIFPDAHPHPHTHFPVFNHIILIFFLFFLQNQQIDGFLLSASNVDSNTVNGCISDYYGQTSQSSSSTLATAPDAAATAVPEGTTTTTTTTIFLHHPNINNPMEISSSADEVIFFLDHHFDTKKNKNTQ